MKSESPNPGDGSLNNLLNEWKIDSALPPRFSEAVWRRVERGEPLVASPFELLQNWIERTTPRPAFVVSYVTSLLLVGLMAGYWQAHVKSERATETLGVRYVQMVDPYQRIHH